eukprot:scaffold1415_cov117-Isochrysis_galbana.AAC.6
MVHAPIHPSVHGGDTHLAPIRSSPTPQERRDCADLSTPPRTNTPGAPGGHLKHGPRTNPPICSWGRDT